jgi:hypothetical protein
LDASTTTAINYTTVDLPPGAWTGFNAQGVGSPFTSPELPQASFQVPLSPASNNFYILPESAYSPALSQLVPLTGTFETNQVPPFAVPHWWLCLRTRLQFSLVDTDEKRLVDYVNLDSVEAPVDITYSLMKDAQCGTSYVPSGDNGNMWCTNQYLADNDDSPTYGIMNQIAASSGLPASYVNWSFAQAEHRDSAD